MAERGGKARSRKWIKAAGAALLVPVLLPPVIRRLDHGRDDGEDLLAGEGLQMEDAYATSQDGTRLHLTVTGRGDRTLFLVHGWTCNESIFRFQQQHFSKDYRVVTLELRGHGKSALPADLDYSVDRLAEDLKAAIDFMNPGDFAVIGFSLGGHTTLKFYERFLEGYEGRLKGIVLIDSSGFGFLEGVILGGVWKKFYPFPISGGLWLLGRPNPLFNYIRKLLNESSYAYMLLRVVAYGKKPCGNHVELQRECSFSTNFTTTCLALRAGLAFDCDCLGRVNVPVQIFVGERDILISEEIARRTAEIVPDARLTVFPDAGHNTLLERRHQVNEEIESFLGEVFAT